jgi:tRNA (mo5U34)-methyltransferase
LTNPVSNPERTRAQFPQTIDDFKHAGDMFAADLRDLKKRPLVADYGWYPYESMTSLPVMSELLAPVYSDVSAVISSSPVVDIGCGDGDLAMFFARLGCDVDAVDHAETNFNQLRGVEALRRVLSLNVHARDIDLDGQFALPRRDYGLALFLGTLYHLKNPFYVLETIAARADWCILSTRIAQVTPGRRTRIEDEPLAYLLGAREANNDPTNYWIFSRAGLLRLLERAGWIVVGHRRVGCSIDSDPVHAEADERLFVILKSRTRHPGLHLRTLAGWHATEGASEQDAFRWTAKRFAIEVTLPERAYEFALRFSVTEAMCEAGPVRVSCAISGHAAGSITCESPDTLEFRGRFPFEAITYRLDFTVESKFQPPGDTRELGICVPLLDASQRQTERIPFRIS